MENENCLLCSGIATSLPFSANPDKKGNYKILTTEEIERELY